MDKVRLLECLHRLEHLPKDKLPPVKMYGDLLQSCGAIEADSRAVYGSYTCKDWYKHLEQLLYEANGD